MKAFVSFLAIVLLSFYENVKAHDINEKAIPMADFPLSGEHVWWVAKVTQYEEHEGVTLTDLDKKFCNIQTFFEHCGPLRYKYDVVNKEPVVKLWALNKNDNKIYYLQAKAFKIHDKKAVFQLKVDKRGKVAGVGESPQTLQISENLIKLLGKPHAIQYFDPMGRFYITSDDRNTWIAVRDYVVRQNQVEELYNKEIVEIVKNLGIPEDKLVTPGNKFDINVDLLAFEGVNCKVNALPMPGIPEILQQPASGWIVRATHFTPTIAYPPGALTAEDMQSCAPHALFENCGPIHFSYQGLSKAIIWAARKGKDGQNEVLKMEGEVEKLDENLAIFRTKVNRNATVISENGESTPITLSEGAIELIEKPIAVVGASPNHEFYIESDCEGNNVWVPVRQELVDTNQLENFIPTIEEGLKKFNHPKPLVSLKTELPINVDLANL